ncbi:MAG TPA: MlaD family protein [Solirubrobacteraceae bacterium]|nr:MlaD family protein [Solirubrobacteraceae bacterium]
MRRQSQSAFTSPVLIGAVTVLVVLIAVFLAYNANQGLPFVPTQELKVNIADGSDLVVGNDVREGGFRVGLVSAMKPIRLPSGLVGAQLTLQLNEANKKVPTDSTVSIRPLSVLGLKYVEIDTGRSHKYFGNGDTLPVTQTNVPIQLDEVLKTFDAPTRLAMQQNLVGYGDVLAGRGGDLNDTIASLPRLFGHLTPVAQNLSAPSTDLTGFISSLNRFMATVAPVSQVNVRLFGDMATTFQAISHDPNALEQTIAKSPSTLSTGTDSLRAQMPFLVDFTTIGNYLTPATAELRRALPVINPALVQGTKVLGQTPPLDQRLLQTMQALQNLAQNPNTNIAINGLTATGLTLNPMIRYLGPFQTVCDDWNYWWTYLSEHLSAQTNYGYAQRALINLGSISGNGVGQQGANAPADGVSGGPLALFGGTEYLHAQPYGAAIDNQGFADCETGQRGYPYMLNHFDPQHRPLGLDTHTPGDQGPTFAGRSRVPAGETFTREPQTGPALTPNPANP